MTKQDFVANITPRLKELGFKKRSSSGIYAIDGKQRINKMDFDGNVVGVVLAE